MNHHWKSVARAVSVCSVVAAASTPLSAQHRGTAVPPPEPLAMGYTGPYWGFGPMAGYGNLPPRAVYGPSVSPIEFTYRGPYTGYPTISHPASAAGYPYPRSVSSYSSGPAIYPRGGRLGR